ncbi:MAG TPA: EF-hand domain-containing protein [Trichormus sp.]|jgi:hypothetical protein
MSELETQILRQMQSPALGHAEHVSPLQLDVNGSAPGPSRLHQKTAGTERLQLVDQRALPWLELQDDQIDPRDQAVVQQVPAMKDPFQFCAALLHALPEIDKTGKGMSVSALKEYVHEHGSATPEAAAAAIALNHFDHFSVDQGVFDRLFHTRITKAEIANFEKQAKPFAVVANHPEIRNPSVFLSTMEHAFDKIDTNGDGVLEANELNNFINGRSGAERERAAAALILSNNKTLAAIGDDGYFGKEDLLMLGALTNPRFLDELNATVAAVRQDPSNVAGGVVVGSATGYAVAKLSGNQHPMRAAVVVGIASGLIEAYQDGEPERIADRLKDKRQLLEQTAIFNLEVSK